MLPCLVRFHFSEVKKPCLRSKLTLPSRWHVSRQKSGPILFPQQHTHRQHRWTTQILPNTLSTITIFKQKKLLVEIKYCAVLLYYFMFTDFHHKIPRFYKNEHNGLTDFYVLTAPKTCFVRIASRCWPLYSKHETKFSCHKQCSIKSSKSDIQNTFMVPWRWIHLTFL